MSRLLTFVVGAAQPVGPVGVRVGAAILTPAAAASAAVFSDSSGVVFSVTAAANGAPSEVFFSDPDGATFTGQLSVTVTGAAAVLAVEEM